MFVTSKRYRELRAELERIREREGVIAESNGHLRDICKSQAATISLLEAENRLHRENMTMLMAAFRRMTGKEPR